MITLQDLITRFDEDELINLTDRKNAEKINEDVINEAINDAEGEVEGYLNAVGLVSRNNRGRLIYRKDETPPRDLIRRTCDIARYILHEDGVTVTVQKRYDDAVAWLDKVKKDPKMLTGVSDEDKDKDKTGVGVHVIPNPVPPNYYD